MFRKASILLLFCAAVSSCKQAEGNDYDLAAYTTVPLDSVASAPQPTSRSFTISPPSIDGKNCRDYVMVIQLHVKNDSVRSYVLNTKCGNAELKKEEVKKEYVIEAGDTKEKIAKRISKEIGITIPPSSIANKLPLKRGEKVLFQ